ncbi:hypothetical protein LGK97_13910 [Clostridium sp. CS001]|uniref:hypothetical protein n=1 Tax=Clostridium sp. CS001 TaxID=2880648 RepID=UPI001CF5B38C|nr:hypothetical protein [Clostridium sp. CS001]MCB2290837.1 hypothetical protein [Clostridium sp. CS001]
MAKCGECGKRFNVSNAREEYNEEFGGEIDYDEQFVLGAICADCAISDTHSNIGLGQAINMMNGEEDYDQEHVNEYL